MRSEPGGGRKRKKGTREILKAHSTAEFHKVRSSTNLHGESSGETPEYHLRPTELGSLRSKTEESTFSASPLVTLTYTQASPFCGLGT